MQVYLLKPGTFARYMEYLTTKTQTSANQLKVPRTLKRENDVKFMLQNVIDQTSYKKCPKSEIFSVAMNTTITFYRIETA